MFGLEPWQFWAAMAITAFSGFVKGAIGFAMPMVMMSGFSSVMPATMALAAVILPVLLTNIQQALRQGPAAAIASVVKFRWHIGAIIVFMLMSAGFATRIPQAMMYLLLGAPIIAFAIWQLSGRPLTLPVHRQRRAEVVSGAVGGLYGGISGIWGPPLIAYLMSLGIGKAEQVRVQGVVFLIGGGALALVHLFSGLLNQQTLPLSVLLCLPAFAGMQAGFRLQDRLDLGQFRRWTLVLLMLTGGNLLRRALEIGF